MIPFKSREQFSGVGRGNGLGSGDQRRGQATKVSGGGEKMGVRSTVMVANHMQVKAPYSVSSLKWSQGRCCWLPPWLRAVLYALWLLSMEFWEWRERQHPSWSCGSESLRDLGGPMLGCATQQEFWALRTPPR